MVMPLARWVAAVAGVVALGGLPACADRSPESGDAPASPPPGQVDPPATGPTAPRPLDLVTGPVLLLPDAGGAFRIATVIRPALSADEVSDTTGLMAQLVHLPAEFFSRSGRVGAVELSGELRPASEPSACALWPVTPLPSGADLPAGWTVALPAGRIAAVPLDSIDGVPARDSAQWAARLTALASRLPDDTSRTFHARPYVVEHAWRTTRPARGTPTPDTVAAESARTGAIVATLVRRLNQEDAPREERLLLVVDAPSADPRSWRVGWHERAEGDEDALEVAEPLVAFLPSQGGALHLLLGRDDGEQLHADLLVREGEHWRFLWTSPRAICR